MTTRPSRFHLGPVVPITRSTSLEHSPGSQNSKFLASVDGSLQDFVRSTFAGTIRALFRIYFQSPTIPSSISRLRYIFHTPSPNSGLLSQFIFESLIFCFKISLAVNRPFFRTHFPISIFPSVCSIDTIKTASPNSGLFSCFHSHP